MISEDMDDREQQIYRELRSQAAKLPRRPGVYIMRDEKAEVIYVGKARDLRARVRTYFAGGDGRSQIEFLMRRVRQLDPVVTETEDQAFVLERDLINKHKPRYNIRLKDDKSYLSIRVDENSAWPRLELVRKVEQDGARYFGPYSFSYELKNLLEIVKRVVPLRSCADTVFYNRQRPCLEYQIKRCAGPCCLPVDKEQYAHWVRQALSILDGRTASLETDLEAQMNEASGDMRYEDAAVLRDRLATLRSFRSGQRVVSSYAEDRDVFALYREEGLAALSVLNVRFGRISDGANFTFSEVCIPDGQVLQAVLEQFYQGGREVPPEIVLPLEIEDADYTAGMLGKRRGQKVEITVPVRGIKKRLLNLALLNARQHYSSHFDQEARYQDLARALARTFMLKQVPRKIECVDISNLQGSDIVGAIVAFYDGEPDKRSYRKYRISLQGKPDDFAAVFEVVRRRLMRAREENDAPDLLIVDGGAGQLRSALAAREGLGVEIDIVALAKARTASDAAAREVEKKGERVFLPGAEEEICLAEGQELTRFMQRIRDEAHRFVISFHRQRRSGRVLRSSLDGLPGIGPERRIRLLRAFGSVDELLRNPPEEIARAGRMPLALAEKLISRLKK